MEEALDLVPYSRVLELVDQERRREELEQRKIGNRLKQGLRCLGDLAMLPGIFTTHCLYSLSKSFERDIGTDFKPTPASKAFGITGDLVLAVTCPIETAREAYSGFSNLYKTIKKGCEKGFSHYGGL